MVELVVPVHPTPDLQSRRSSLIGAARPVVLPLINNNNNVRSNDINQQNAGNTFASQEKIDPVAVALAAKAARRRPSQPENQYRRGSLDANVEYAVAMVNIVDQSLDDDDRDLCPFGTRRDSVCGVSPRSKRRNLKQKNLSTDTTMPKIDAPGNDFVHYI